MNLRFRSDIWFQDGLFFLLKITLKQEQETETQESFWNKWSVLVPPNTILKESG